MEKKVTREMADLVRLMTQTGGWKILKDRLQEHSDRSKTALRNLLRKGHIEDFSEMVKLQERLDSVEFLLKETERLTTYDKDTTDPIY